MGRLTSQIPLVIPQLWGTIMTGKNPGQHGAFDFWQRGPEGRFREVNGAWLKQPAIRHVLSEQQLRCGIVNMPFTYPPQRINGFMISGQDTPGAHRSIAALPSVYDELVRTFGRYHLKDIFPGGRRKEDYLTLIEEDVRKQTDVLEHLIVNKSWDFFLTFYSATTMAPHYFWAGMESEDKANQFRQVLPDAYRCLNTASDGSSMPQVRERLSSCSPNAEQDGCDPACRSTAGSHRKGFWHGKFLLQHQPIVPMQ